MPCGSEACPAVVLGSTLLDTGDLFLKKTQFFKSICVRVYDYTKVSMYNIPFLFVIDNI